MMGRKIKEKGRGKPGKREVNFLLSSIAYSQVTEGNVNQRGQFQTTYEI